MRKSYSSLSGALILVLFCLFIVAGCSANNNEISSTVEEEEAAIETKAIEEPSTDAEPTERVIQHANGVATVSAHPARVVVLDNGALDNLLALGVKPVGAPGIVSVEAGFAAYLTNTEGITNTGTVNEPNLETIASLKPDLIIGVKDLHDAIYDKLQQIAPTVFTEIGGGQWEANVKQHANAVGKVEEGQKVIDEYYKHVEAFKAKLGDKLGQTEISLLRPRKDRIAISLKQSYTGSVIETIGLPRPAAQQVDDINIAVTEEQIADLDGDIIILFGRQNELAYFEEKIKANPLWQTLKAVQQDQVYSADWEVWLSGHGIQAANRMIDDLEGFMLK